MTETSTPPSPIARLLVVDDEAAVMTAMCHTLRDEGYDVEGVSSAADALVALRKGGFDLLMTDLMMPRTDGIELVRQALEIDPQLSSVVMTGHGTVATAVDAMKIGAIDYVLKPLKLSALRPVLARALTIRRLRTKNAELEASVRAHTEDLEAANQELEAFSYTISHDLRMPLRAINGFTELLLAHHAATLDPQVRRYFDFIRKGGLEMSRLIDAVLAFSRLGRHALSRESIDLEKLCREVFDELANERVDRKVELRLGPLPKVHADPTLVRQVFVNLISNAIKYTRPRASAVIELGIAGHEPDGSTVLFIRDNGVGFDPHYADRLFQVFQRLHSLSEFEGTGVGLATVRRIIERHSGRIWAESKPDQGATFYFTLPVVTP